MEFVHINRTKCTKLTGWAGQPGRTKASTTSTAAAAWLCLSCMVTGGAKQGISSTIMPGKQQNIYMHAYIIYMKVLYILFFKYTHASTYYIYIYTFRYTCCQWGDCMLLVAPFYHLPPEPGGYIILTRSIGAITSLRWKPLCSMVVGRPFVK